MRDLRCPQAARAVPLVCQNEKVESSRSAEQILVSGKSTAVSEPAINISLRFSRNQLEWKKREKSKEISAVSKKE